MTQAINHDEMVALLRAVADDMIAAKDELAALDAAVGDGDLGRTVERGFRALADALPVAGDPSDADIGRLLFKLGRTFSDAAASSFGGLFGTALQKAGMALRDRREASATDLTEALQAGYDALMERGKAKLGDKTMLDALHPAIEAMRAAITQAGGDVPAERALRAAADAAAEGARCTEPMQALTGRASWLGERSVGHVDPGARAIALLFESMARHLRPS
jgi:dihydroxyacetone kinase-like protein